MLYIGNIVNMGKGKKLFDQSGIGQSVKDMGVITSIGLAIVSGK